MEWSCSTCIISIFILILYNMVYIKLAKEQWIALGLAQYLKSNDFEVLQNLYYLSYNNFKKASSMTQQPLHASIKRQNIITNLQMKQAKRLAEQTPEERKLMQNIKARQQMRKLNSYSNKQAYYFENKSSQSVKDLSKSISFGMTFIFSFFMAGLTGYYFGTFFLGLDFTKSLMISIIFIILTILIQTTLYIIKQNKEDAKERRKKEKTFTKATYPKKGAKLKTQ